MFRRGLAILLMALSLSLVLAACGDENVTIPSYTGGTSVAVPDTLKTQMAASVKDFKDIKVEAYKTSDPVSKIKTFYADSLNKDGWKDKAGELADTSKQLDSIGAFLLGYEKSNKQVAVMGLPGTVAGPMGFSGVNTSDSLYIIFSGNK